MIHCPLCEAPMNAVTARANPGSLIELDQCRQCGGIWCDKWELFLIQTDEAGRLEPIDQERLRAPLLIEKKTLFCPRCSARLVTLKDPSLAPDIQFQRCLKCDGIWLNQGQFTGFKNHQREVRKKKMEGSAALTRIADAYGDPNAWVVTGTRGMFAYPAPLDDNRQIGRDTARGIVRIVLQSLLRMLLGI